MELRKLCNDRVGIVNGTDVVAFLSDRNEVIIQPPYALLSKESLDEFWKLIILVRGEVFG